MVMVRFAYWEILMVEVTVLFDLFDVEVVGNSMAQWIAVILMGCRPTSSVVGLSC